MSNIISFPSALQMAITDLQKPIISKFEIFYLALKISKNNSYQGHPIAKQRTPFGISRTSNLIGTLLKKRFLSHDSDFRSYYKITDEDKGTCEEACCLVDPFCYLSHLSAMQKYGLTDRIPEIVILTTPRLELWKEMKVKIEKNYEKNFIDKTKYLTMTKPSFPKVVRKMKTKIVETVSLHPSSPIRDSYARISKIGYTFLDMLINPKLCGGMSHIIDVWKENAQIYLEDIIKAVDEQPKGIIKVRAGYIIDEILNIKDNRVNKWQEFAQRGGSRLLDPNSPYIPKFSEKWMVSINV